MWFGYIETVSRRGCTSALRWQLLCCSSSLNGGADVVLGRTCPQRVRPWRRMQVAYCDVSFYGQ
jgi:hypothetical protein